MLPYTVLQRFATDKQSSLLDPFTSCKENEVLGIWPIGPCIHKIVFSLQFKNEPNKLDCFTIPCCKALPLTNTLAYRTHSQVAKKMKCCEYGPRFEMVRKKVLPLTMSTQLYNFFPP
jgi:hypothetical protein